MADEAVEARHENLLLKLEGWVAGELDGPIRRLVDRVEQTLGRAEERLKTLMAAMENLEGLIGQITDAIGTVSTEVNDLISRLQAASNAEGLTAEQAATLATDLQTALAKIQAIAPEPPAP